MVVTAGQDGCLKFMKPTKGGERKIVANELRENLRQFVNSEIGSEPWQLYYVRIVA